jgi:hypothetical protein
MPSDAALLRVATLAFLALLRLGSLNKAVSALARCFLCPYYCSMGKQGSTT